MTLDNVREIFVNILESTPGIKEILNNEKSDEESSIKISNTNGLWNFVAHVVILQNSNCKAIFNNISGALRYQLHKNKQKIGSLNIIIEGISND